MSIARTLLIAALLSLAWGHDALADKKTVCTITINSTNEREVFRGHLPEADFQFVELVEKGRQDWLQAACREGVRCDVLLISGHFDDGTEFYSGRPDAPESLPVEEMERASCSSCGLFSQLKEVYLFGCSTLDPRPLKSASPEIARSLVRAGRSSSDAEQLSQALGKMHAESNRDHMREIFRDVPVIYGFSSKAPLGATAGPMLEQYFQSGAGGDIGTGQVSDKLVRLFAPASMTVAVGLNELEPQASYRRDVCHFSDDRLSTAEKLEFVHQILKRNAAEVRMFLDRIEQYVGSLNVTERDSSPISEALAAIAADGDAHVRFMEFARDADEPATRARMIRLAGKLGWLSPRDQRAELVNMINEQLGRTSVGSADVDLACALNQDGELSRDADHIHLARAQAGSVAHAALLACLGDRRAHAIVLKALTGADEKDAQVAQVYLRHRPLEAGFDLHQITRTAARMGSSDAQVRALTALTSYRLSDRESLEELLRAFAMTKSVDVQRAVAGILVRSDLGDMAKADIAQRLRQRRLKSSDGADMIDVLIRRLEIESRAPQTSMLRAGE